MTSEETKQVNEIIENFNFQKVHDYMTVVNWQWAHPDGCFKTPDIETMKSNAVILLCEAFNGDTPTNVGTGGFMVYKMPWGIYLSFQITNWWINFPNKQ